MGAYPGVGACPGHYGKCMKYNLFKDIVSLRVEVGHISVPRPEVIDWFTVAVEEGGFGRHD